MLFPSALKPFEIKPMKTSRKTLTVKPSKQGWMRKERSDCRHEIDSSHTMRRKRKTKPVHAQAELVPHGPDALSMESSEFLKLYRESVAELKKSGETIRDLFDRLQNREADPDIGNFVAYPTLPLVSKTRLQSMMRSYILRLNRLAMSCLANGYFKESSRLLAESDGLCENCEGEPYYVEVKVITMSNHACCASVRSASSLESNKNINDPSVPFLQANDNNGKNALNLQELENTIEILQKAIRLARRDSRVSMNELPLIYLHCCIVLVQMNKLEGALRYAQLAVCFAQKSVTATTNEVKKAQKKDLKNTLIIDNRNDSSNGERLKTQANKKTERARKARAERILTLAIAYHNLAVILERTNHFDMCIQWHKKAKLTCTLFSPTIPSVFSQNVRCRIEKSYRKSVRRQNAREHKALFSRKETNKRTGNNVIFPPVELNEFIREKAGRQKYRAIGINEGKCHDLRKHNSGVTNPLPKHARQKKKVIRKKKRTSDSTMSAWRETNTTSSDEKSMSHSYLMNSRSTTSTSLSEQSNMYFQAREEAILQLEEVDTFMTQPGFRHLRKGEDSDLRTKVNCLHLEESKNNTDADDHYINYSNEEKNSSPTENENSKAFEKPKDSLPHEELLLNVSKIRTKKAEMWKSKLVEFEKEEKRLIMSIEKEKQKRTNRIKEEEQKKELLLREYKNLERKYTDIDKEFKHIENEEEVLIKKIQDETRKRNMWRKARLDMCMKQKHELDKEMHVLMREDVITFPGKKSTYHSVPSKFESKMDNLKAKLLLIDNLDDEKKEPKGWRSESKFQTYGSIDTSDRYRPNNALTSTGMRRETSTQQREEKDGESESKIERYCNAVDTIGMYRPRSTLPSAPFQMQTIQSNPIGNNGLFVQQDQHHESLGIKPEVSHTYAEIIEHGIKHEHEVLTMAHNPDKEFGLLEATPVECSLDNLEEKEEHKQLLEDEEGKQRNNRARKIIYNEIKERDTSNRITNENSDRKISEVDSEVEQQHDLKLSSPSSTIFEENLKEKERSTPIQILHQVNQNVCEINSESAEREDLIVPLTSSRINEKKNKDTVSNEASSYGCGNCAPDTNSETFPEEKEESNKLDAETKFVSAPALPRIILGKPADQSSEFERKSCTDISKQKPNKSNKISHHQTPLEQETNIYERGRKRSVQKRKDEEKNVKNCGDKFDRKQKKESFHEIESKLQYEAEAFNSGEVLKVSESKFQDDFGDTESMDKKCMTNSADMLVDSTIQNETGSGIYKEITQSMLDVTLSAMGHNSKSIPHKALNENLGIDKQKYSTDKQSFSSHSSSCSSSTISSFLESESEESFDYRESGPAFEKETIPFSKFSFVSKPEVETTTRTSATGPRQGWHTIEPNTEEEDRTDTCSISSSSSSLSDSISSSSAEEILW